MGYSYGYFFAEGVDVRNLSSARFLFVKYCSRASILGQEAPRLGGAS